MAATTVQFTGSPIPRRTSHLVWSRNSQALRRKGPGMGWRWDRTNHQVLTEETWLPRPPTSVLTHQRGRGGKGAPHLGEAKVFLTPTQPQPDFWGAWQEGVEPDPPPCQAFRGSSKGRSQGFLSGSSSQEAAWPLQAPQPLPKGAVGRKRTCSPWFGKIFKPVYKV